MEIGVTLFLLLLLYISMREGEKTRALLIEQQDKNEERHWQFLEYLDKQEAKQFKHMAELHSHISEVKGVSREALERLYTEVTRNFRPYE